MLQRRQDTISEGGCDGGCNNSRVYKGLVFTGIVTQSLSSFLLSTFYCFPYLQVGGQAFSGFVVVGKSSGGLGKRTAIGEWLGERDGWSVWADLPVPGFVGPALRQVLLCSGRIPVGGTHPWWK